MANISCAKKFFQSTCKKPLSVSVLTLRLAMGAMFFYAGWSKIFSPEGWSAAGYLSVATGPFAEWFQAMAGSPLVDMLNMWGLLLIGIALLLGIFVRPASFFGGILMLLYYFAQFDQNVAYGYIDEHLIYFFIFVLFFFGGFGHVCGLDGVMKKCCKLKSKKWAKCLLG